jgi:hypothetical protein
MSLPIISAHGALGNLDEIIFLGVAVTFIMLMVVTWLRSRSNIPDDGAPPGSTPPDNTPDRFHLD